MPPKTQTHYHCGGCEKLLEASQFTEAQKVGRYDQRRRCIACLESMRTLLETGQLPEEQKRVADHIKANEAKAAAAAAEANTPPPPTWLATLSIDSAQMKPTAWLPIAELLAGDRNNKTACDLLCLGEEEFASLPEERRCAMIGALIENDNPTSVLQPLGELLLKQVTTAAAAATATTAAKSQGASSSAPVPSLFLSGSGLDAVLLILTHFVAAAKRLPKTSDPSTVWRVAFQVSAALVSKSTESHRLPWSHRAAARWFRIVTQLVLHLDDKQKSQLVPLISHVATATTTATRRVHNNSVHSNSSDDAHRFPAIMALSSLLLLLPLSPFTQEARWIMIVDYADFARDDAAGHDLELTELAGSLYKPLQSKSFCVSLQPKQVLLLHCCLRAIVLACPVAGVAKAVNDFITLIFNESDEAPLRVLFAASDNILRFAEMLTAALQSADFEGGPFSILLFKCVGNLGSSMLNAFDQVCRAGPLLLAAISLAHRFAAACERGDIILSSPTDRKSQKIKQNRRLFVAVLSAIHSVHVHQTHSNTLVECLEPEKTIELCFRLSRLVADAETACSVMDSLSMQLTHGPQQLSFLCNRRLLPRFLEGGALQRLVADIAPHINLKSFELHPGCDPRSCFLLWFRFFGVLATHAPATMSTTPGMSAALTSIFRRLYAKMDTPAADAFIRTFTRLVAGDWANNSSLLTEDSWQAIVNSRFVDEAAATRHGNESRILLSCAALLSQIRKDQSMQDWLKRDNVKVFAEKLDRIVQVVDKSSVLAL